MGPFIPISLHYCSSGGLCGMMRTAFEVSLYNGFKVDNMVEYNILQFADDTIFMGDGSYLNLWGIKCVLRGFELVSILSVNFYKRKLYDVNIGEDFLISTKNFLFCQVDVILFKFLNLSVNVNQRILAMWMPMVDSLKRKFSAWIGRFLAYGGRITLINSVLINLPIYFLSLFKAFKQVVKEFITIQRRSLWKDSAKKKGNYWVRWNDVCKKKRRDWNKGC